MALEKEDYIIATKTARALHRRSQGFFEDFLSRTEVEPQPKRIDIGEVVASATELCLAVELYLKAVYVNKGVRIPKTHDLFRLFNLLPSDVLKERIRSIYDKLSPPRSGDANNVEIVLESGGIRIASHWQLGKIEQPASLDDVLKHCGNGFETWRYVYESLRDTPVASHIFPYRRLNAVADVLLSMQTHRVVVKERKPSKKLET